MNFSSEREEDLFHRALALPEGERAAFLGREAADNPELRVSVESLLRFHDDAQRSLLSVAPGAAEAVAQLASAPVEKPGDTIGRYKLLQKIGEGGCGVVYMAEQQEPVVRRVALKVIKLGMDTREVIARFEAERQALAMMEHPNIARVHDAGATVTGRPFFVMELVRGVPITTYCDEQNLSTAARLELFTLVCHAVQHAHQKGIIHRDLKPSNILVTLHDGRPVPKVIDFGIAKATQGKLTNSTLFTAFEQFIGTPAYVSPEQAELSGLDIDTRSDIYSLGVLLYELLTGRTPFDPKSLLAAGLDEIRRIIREVDPPRPSTRLSTLTDVDRSTIAKHRSTAPAHLSVILRGDLDWIVMHCLEKNRTRRYDTPSALAADIARHLTHEPVQARPPSAVYRLGKMIRRNRLFFTAAAAMVAALVLGFGISAWQWFEKNQAFHRATEAERTQAALRERAEAAGMREAEQRRLAEGNAIKAAQQEAYARRLLYAADMNLAHQALQANDVGRARRLLERHQPKPAETDLRGWEWRYLWQQSRNSALATLTRHTDRVNWLSFSPDSRWLAIGHWDGRIELWDVPARTLRTTLRTTGAYGAVCFSPTENLVAYAAGVGRIVVHDLDTATNKFLLAPDGGAAERFSFSPDGARLACVSDYGVQVFSLVDGNLAFRRLDGFTGSAHFGAVRFSPDGATLFVNRQQNGNELTVAALDPRDGKLKREFTVGHDAGQTSLALSPDGRVLATASGFGDETVRVWNPETGAAIAELKNHTAWVGEVAFSPDGKFLASAAADQTIRLWDTTAWSETAVLRGHGNEVHAIAFSPDGRLIASGDKSGEVLLWSTDRFTTVQSRFSFPTDIVKAWIPPDTNYVLTLSKSGGVSRWDLATLKETPVNLPGPVEFFWRPEFFGLRAPNHTIRVYQVLLADTRLVGEAVVGERARRIEFRGAQLTWEDASGRNQEKELRPGSAAQNSRNMFPLSVGMEAGRVVFRQRADPQKVVAMHELPGESESLVYSHDRTRVAVSTDHGVVALFDRTGKQLLRLRAHMKSVCTVVFSPDDRRLITIGSTRELAKVWDIETGQELLTLPGAGSNSYEAAMSSDGNALLAGTNGEGHWQLWQAPDWAEIDAVARLASEGSAQVRQKPAVASIRDPDNGIYIVLRDPVSGAFRAPATPLTPHYPESNFGPAWSPDGKQIAFKRRRPTVVDRPEQFFDLVVQPVGSTQERVYQAIESEPGQWTAPVWSPDMRSVIVRNFVDMTVRKNHRINLADESVNTLPVAPEKSAVMISHDGRTLYSTINDRKEKTVSLLSVDAATGSITKVWTSPFPMHEHQPPLRLALSPDGRTLAMVLKGPRDESHLVRVGTNGSDYRVLVTANRISRSGLCWAENGRALLYCATSAVDEQLMRISADGGLPRFTGLTLRGDADVIFDLSPDGEQFAVAPGMPIFTNPDDINNDVMWEWVLAQEVARHLEPAESVARELLGRYQQQNGTPLGHAGTRTVLGRILVRREKFAEAEEVLRSAYQARNNRAPDDWLTHITRSVLGGALVGAGKLAEAEPLLLEAYRGLTVDFQLSKEDEPRPTEAAEWLAGLEEKRGHTEKAAQWRQRGRGFNFAVRAQRLLENKEYIQAAEGFEVATRIDPTLHSVWNALGWLRATAPDPTARSGRAAVAAALKACELTAYKNAAYVDTLAAAHAESGDFDRAVEHQQNALQQGKPTDRERAGYEARLALYRGRRPFHQPPR